VRSENPFTVDPFQWINSLIAQFDSDHDHFDFLEAVKLEMYSDKVFCFSPKGDVIKLPKGATPIDFAYAIHTRIGNACVGAKVDGLRVPLWTRLRNGQSIEVITAQGQNPQPTWLQMAETGKAKTAIRRALREADRKKFIVMGQELARAAFEHVGKRATDKVLETAAKKMGVGDLDELLARMGSAEFSARDVVRSVYPKLGGKEAVDVDMRRAVIGLSPGQSFNRSPCCQALPGERIVGIAAHGHGVAVHSIDCQMLVDYEDLPELWLDLHWHSGQHAAVYPVTLQMTLGNDAGVLGRVCTLIGEQRANISDLEFIDRNPDFYRLNIDVDLRDIEQLHAVSTVLQAEGEVASVRRLRAAHRGVNES
jgi:GTP pyrophosphokinase/guanosine-3',5'-bis(diphosphate) 3'-pyrophosphohydrolase